MKPRGKSIIPFLIVAGMIALSLMELGCKKEQLLQSGGELRFSADTVLFDTVFTSEGSFTLGVKIYNPQDQKITISSVRVEGGNASFYHLNVDGFTGNEVKNLEVAAKDSIYVFATVKVDPTNADNPFVVADKLIATLNGKDFSIPLLAYGQNAHYIVDSVLKTQTWGTDKPYVIIHSAEVDAGETLTVRKGCRIFMHADSRLYVLGNMIASGTKKDSIIFQGDRLDRKYFGNEGYPGEWPGIYIDPGSTGNVMDWVILKNCGSSPDGRFAAALWVAGKPGNQVQLTMSHTIIENSLGYGLLSFNGNITASNCLIHSTGAQAFAGFEGGKYVVNNCDFINYFPAKLSHTDNPTVSVVNYYDTTGNGDYRTKPLDASFTNCLIYGSLKDELYSNGTDTAHSPVRASFNYCLIKSSQSTDVLPGNIGRQNCKFNEDPGFRDYVKWDFRAKTSSSPLVDAGTNIPAITDDLDGKPRSGPFDIGCYEF